MEKTFCGAQSEPQITHLTEHQLAQRLNVSVRTLQGWRIRGEGVPFLKLGRCIRYPIAAVEGWERAHLFLSTSAVGACSIHQMYGDPAEGAVQ
ncbi:helix-turn-helix transcriptional regulator [Parafrankia sp. BMG5.11]|uniref:helix-turn-helix transcriptional regulator n=1 Tax=Parafrankia sp. BMG5.11 TaxID=222540 RepID=UPI0035A06354